MDGDRLSIIIVSYNVADLLSGCLQSVAEPPCAGRRQVIIVDNASDDDTPRLVSAGFPWVTLVANQANVGFAAANDQGIRMQDARYVLLLNPDTIVHGNALQAMCDAMDAHPEIGIIGPRIVNPDGSLQSGPHAFPTAASLVTGRQRTNWRELAGGISEADWVLGAALMIRREVIEQIGLMDEGYFLYAEEKDWCYRAKQAGWKVGVLMAAEVVHLGGQSTAQRAPQSYEALIDSQVRFLSKFYGANHKRAYLVSVLANAGGRECVARAMGVARPFWAARAATYAAGRRRAWMHLVGAVRPGTTPI